MRLAEGTALAPLGLIPITQAIASGDKEDLYVAIRQYIDAPLWVADPTIDAFAEVLAPPLDGTDGIHEVETPGLDGQLIQFRDKVLWGATSRVRESVADVLGVDPNLGGQAPDFQTNTAASSTRSVSTVGKDNRVLGSINLGKFAPGSHNGSGSTVGADKTDGPRPGRAVVKAINDQVKASAERIDRAVKKLAGEQDDKDANAGSEGTAD